VEHCIALGYQLAGLVKDGFLKEYLEGNQEGSKEESVRIVGLKQEGMNCFQTFFGSFEGMKRIKEESQPKE